jgi:hypothetical protein
LLRSALLQMAVVTLGTTKQPLPGFTGRVAAPKEHGEMGYNYELAAAMPPVSTIASCFCSYCLWWRMCSLAADSCCCNHGAASFFLPELQMGYNYELAAAMPPVSVWLMFWYFIC